MFYKTVRRFLDPDGSQGGAPAGEQTDQQSQQNATPQIDYGKIQQMLDGTLAAKEDTALKAYFKQQGLSQQEVEQAIATFKEQKAANQPNVEALQQLQLLWPRQDRHRSNRQRRWQQSDWESA